jgi:hypothetical protein
MKLRRRDAFTPRRGNGFACGAKLIYLLHARAWPPTYSGDPVLFENYQLYRHPGLDDSIFPGEAQIAAGPKSSVIIGSAGKYQLRVTDDANLVAILCMVLAIAVTDGRGRQFNPHLPWDNVGPQERTFNGQRVPS